MKVTKKSDLAVGMVIRIPNSDGSIHAFSDSLVEDFTGTMVHLARPMMVPAAGEAGFSFHIERYQAGIASLIAREAEIVQEGQHAFFVVTKKGHDDLRAQAYEACKSRLELDPETDLQGFFVRYGCCGIASPEFKNLSLWEKITQFSFRDCQKIVAHIESW